MKYLFSCLISGFILFAVGKSYGQSARYDSTLKMGKVGYRIICNNKNDDKNELTVKPVGFENTARPFMFYIKGRVVKAEIDDLDNNNFPDAVVYMYGGKNGEYGNVFAFVSEQNKSIAPVALPDVMLDGKINGGYKGHDVFSLMEGTLMQKFPLYKAGDSTDKPSGGNRIIQYNLAGSENGGYKFKMLRFYDLK